MPLDLSSRRGFLSTGSLALASVAATGLLPAFAQDAQTQVLLGVAAQQLPGIPATKRTVIIDTDPGQDDAIALLFALAAPERLDVRALTVSVGNMPLSITEKNTRRVRDWAGRADVPVYAGYPRPLIRDPIFADDVHGGVPAAAPRGAGGVGFPLRPLNYLTCT